MYLIYVSNQYFHNTYELSIFIFHTTQFHITLSSLIAGIVSQLKEVNNIYTTIS